MSTASIPQQRQIPGKFTGRVQILLPSVTVVSAAEISFLLNISSTPSLKHQQHQKKERKSSKPFLVSMSITADRINTLSYRSKKNVRRKSKQDLRSKIGLG